MTVKSKKKIRHSSISIILSAIIGFSMIFSAAAMPTSGGEETYDDEIIIDLDDLDDLGDLDPGDMDPGDLDPSDEDPANDGDTDQPNPGEDSLPPIQKNENKEPSEDSASVEGTLPELTTSGMTLTPKMLEEKAALSKSGVVQAVQYLIEDVDYVNHEVVYATESEKEAQQVAKAYNGVLTSFSEGIAVIKVARDTEAILLLAEDMSSDFPAVYPNLIYTLESSDYSEEDIDAAKKELGDNNEDEEENLPEPEIETIIEPIDDPESIVTVFEEKPVTQGDIDALDYLQNNSVITDADLQGLETEAKLLGSRPNDKYAGLQWHHDKIGTYDAWDYAKNKGSGVKVAIIDSGIWGDHPDLKNNIIGKYSTSTYAINGSKDNYGHGTHVAGIIAATGGNKIGVTGVAPKASIISIKALDYTWADTGPRRQVTVKGTTADIIRAVNMAVSKGAQVINMSVGQENPGDDGLYAKAVEKAINKGIIVVAAAGNDNTSDPYYPACFPNVIKVSATTEIDTKALYSNFGNGDTSNITIAAPGGESMEATGADNRPIASTYKANTYSWMSGTSMAAPMVTGVVALLISQNSAYKNSKNIDRVTHITNILKDTADEDALVGYSESHFGAGLVSASDAAAKLAGVVAAPIFSNDIGETLASGATLTTTDPTGGYDIAFSGGGEGAVYHYTIDGKTPTLASKRAIETPTGGEITLALNGKTRITVKAVAAINGKLSKVTTATYKVDVKINNITLKPKSGIYSVAVGKKLTLTPTFAPTKPKNKTLKWESSDTAIATVDSKGVVTGKSVGDDPVTITATNAASGEAVTASISVTTPTKSISLSEKKVKLSTIPATIGSEDIEKFHTLIVTSYPEDALTDPANFTFKTSKKSVATVDATGKITAVASGSATITVTTRDGTAKSATCKVTVIKPAILTSVTCSAGQPAGTDYVVGKGKTVTLKAVFADKKATNTKVKWSSDDKTIATVTSKGVVKGISEGTANITVSTADGIYTGTADGTKTIEITVMPASAGLTSNAKSTTLKISKDVPKPVFSWVVSNKTPLAHPEYVYTTKNKKVATVSNTGVITAVNKGKTTITAKAMDGSGRSTTITVTVVKLVTSIVLSVPPTAGIAYGKSMKFKATVYPTDASNKKLNWFVSNTSYFKVDSSGNVKVIKKHKDSLQTTRVYVTSKDGNVSARHYFSSTPKITIVDAAGTQKTDYSTTDSGQAEIIEAFDDANVKMQFVNGLDKNKKLTSYTAKEFNYIVGVKLLLYHYIEKEDTYKYADITSSNARVAEYVYTDIGSGAGGEGYEPTMAWVLKVSSPGTATIKAKAIDGSGKSTTLKVTVKAVGDFK